MFGGFLFPRGNGQQREPSHALGHLELRVMGILWAGGESNVREVASKLERPLAYTTVMTTLDRLYKKGLLERRKAERAFFYRPRLSQVEWQRARAGELVEVFLAGPEASRALLFSSFLETMEPQDERLLEELEQALRRKRAELARRDRGQP